MTQIYVRKENGIILGWFAGPQEDYPDLVLMDTEDPEFISYSTPAAPAYYQISKMTPWLRMTDAEAVLMRSAMDAAPIRLQEIYKAAPYLQSNDDLWPTLWGMLAANLSPSRAGELLAPE